jgi:hypothetical protein
MPSGFYIDLVFVVVGDVHNVENISELLERADHAST